MNKSHDDLAAEYMEFARFQRLEHVKAIQGCFKRYIDSRLLEGTYTSEEVEEILKEICECICGDIESELINICHMNVLLLKQLFVQAETLGFILKGNISEMQNGDLLEQMREKEMANTSANLFISKFVNIEACNDEASCSGHQKVNKLTDPDLTHENLKKILRKKNDVIKDLRERLQNYEGKSEEGT